MSYCRDFHSLKFYRNTDDTSVLSHTDVDHEHKCIRQVYLVEVFEEELLVDGIPVLHPSPASSLQFCQLLALKTRSQMVTGLTHIEYNYYTHLYS